MKAMSFHSQKKREAFWGYAFIFPLMLGFLVFTLIPFVTAFYWSLTKYDGITVPKFIGLDNYVRLFHDADFLSSLWHTFYFTIGTVPTGAIVGLLVAVVLNANIRFANAYRTAFFIPVVTSLVAVSQVWKWMYNKDYGLINGILDNLGLYQPPWLASAAWAMPAIMTMSVWKGLGLPMVIYLAGLQGISPSLYEAAKIDGAGAVKRFWYISLPLLRHATLFVVVITLIDSFQVFDQVFVMTDGGPTNSTTVVVYWIYKNAFRFFKQGYASAMAYVLFAIIFIVTIIQMKVTQRKDVY